MVPKNFNMSKKLSKINNCNEKVLYKYKQYKQIIFIYAYVEVNK